METTRQVTTMCPMNCHPTYCGMRVDVSADRLIGVSGDPENPDSRGFLCVRGRAAYEIRDNPRRLLTPLRRVGPRGSDRWAPMSWEVAFDTITAAINATSRERVGLWMGHGASVTGANRPLLSRFGHLGGFQVWNPAMVCWALGAYGLALAGVLETNTKEDMADHSATILLWGASMVSQPTTAPHLVAARRRGAHITLIDCRRSETARHADEVLLIRPGSDAALALAMAHVLVTEGLTDEAFLAEHSLGYAEFTTHLREHSPEWAAPIVGLEPEQIRALARRYATAKPAMIVLGGSSIFKHRYGWEAGRAIACLPALTGQLGVAGGGFGPRHRGLTRGDAYAALDAFDRRPPGNYIPSHMPSMAAAFENGQIDLLMLFGCNMLSSFADTAAVERGLAKTGLIVVHDIFPNETIRRAADIVLPGTVWVEELGIKDTATHLYLMEQALPALGEARSARDVLRGLANRLELADFHPWPDDEHYINAWLAPLCDEAGAPLTVAALRAAGGRMQRSHLSQIAYPDRRFHTPSGKIEFWSERARGAGLAPLPSFTPAEFTATTAAIVEQLPLQLGQGRTISHFHSFYDEGRALPSLARLNPGPEVWVHPDDAAPRGIGDGARVLLCNERGSLEVTARVTDAARPGVLWIRDGWFGLNHLTSGAGALSAEASTLIHPFAFPGGQAAYDARVELRLLL